MANVKIKYTDSVSKLPMYLEFEGKESVSFYNKYFNCDWRIGCDISIAEKDIRYLQWADKHDLVPSKYAFNYGEKGQKKRLDWGKAFSWFDHTSFWRKKHENKPLFCLTEPYDGHIKSESKQFGIDGLEVAVYQPSKNSLWFPEQTWMFFYYHPHRKEEMKAIFKGIKKS